jgi:rSAM/selenodomain-associated transferase 1
MAKQPVAGRVKTRLAREIGTVAATMLYRGMTAAVIARLSGGGRPWETIVALARDPAVRQRSASRRTVVQPQARGDLGRRMQAAIDRQPPGPVVLVGTDIPAIRPHHIREAFRALGAHDAVIGAAEDGGYWLIGLRRIRGRIRPFTGVRWSSEHALADTLAQLRGYSVARVATLSDVDTANDARLVSGWCGRRVLPLPGNASPAI